MSPVKSAPGSFIYLYLIALLVPYSRLLGCYLQIKLKCVLEQWFQLLYTVWTQTVQGEKTGSVIVVLLATPLPEWAGCIEIALVKRRKVIYLLKFFQTRHTTYFLPVQIKDIDVTMTSICNVVLKRKPNIRIRSLRDQTSSIILGEYKKGFPSFFSFITSWLPSTTIHYSKGDLA